MTSSRSKWLLGVFLLVSVAKPVGAHTWNQPGINSNLLVFDGKVYFIQADLSLTALDLATGRVLLRKVDQQLRGPLQLTEHGILKLGWGEIVLLDKRTHAVRWKTRVTVSPNVCEGSLVSYGKGVVQCRDLQNGQVRWSYGLPGGLAIVAEKGKVLIHCPAIFPSLCEPALALLDLKTGRELFLKRPPADTVWGRAFFDGERIYLGAGTIRTTPMEANFERLLVWDLTGRELTATEVPRGATGASFYPDAAFCLDGKVFQYGRVRPMTAEEKATGRVCGARRGPDWHLESDGTVVKIRWRNGWRNGPRDPRKPITIVEMNSKTGAWRGYLPYLTQWPGRVQESALTDGKLVLGSNLGHVECVHVATGRSLWIYVFRSMWGTISMTGPNGRPLYLVERAKAYRQENWRTRPGGLHLLPPGMSLDEIRATMPASRPAGKGPRVVHDPQPVDSFADVPSYLVKAWSGAILPVIGFALLCLAAWKRRWGYRGVGFSACAMGLLLVTIMFFYSRVSGACTLTAKVALVLLLGVVAYGVYKAGRNRQWNTAFYMVILGTLAACVSLIIFLEPCVR